MSNSVEKIGTANSLLLLRELQSIIEKYNLSDHRQISVTSEHGENDFQCSTGRMANLKKPESFYNKLNKSFRGSYVEQCIAAYPDYYRWRFLKLPGRTCYSIHHDNDSVHHPDKKNIRLHIPVLTNNHAFMIFFHDHDVSYVHLRKNNVYKVNTSLIHSAVNHGDQDRIHLVGVSYA